MSVLGTMKAVALVGGIGAAGGAAVGLSGPLQKLHEIHKDFHEMNLSAEQKQQLHGILRSHKAEVRAASDRLWEARLAVHDAAREATLDEALIRRRASEAGVAAGDLAVLKAKVHGEVRAVLRPEQNEKAEEIHGHVREGMAELRQLARHFADEHLREE